jgi:hypothetical protein
MCMQVDKHVRQKGTNGFNRRNQKVKKLIACWWWSWLLWLMMMTVAWLQLILNTNAHKTLGLSIRMSTAASRTRRGRTWYSRFYWRFRSSEMFRCRWVNTSRYFEGSSHLQLQVKGLRRYLKVSGSLLNNTTEYPRRLEPSANPSRNLYQHRHRNFLKTPLRTFSNTVAGTFIKPL